MTLRFRRLLLPILALTLLASSYLHAQCGVERWSVKTGTDADAGLVNLNTSTSTAITNMRAFAAPSPIPANNRVSPAETTVWVINATLTLFKLESDSDYHLVIQDAAGNTMITEIPSPTCVGAGSPFLADIQNARAKFDAQFTATTSFQTANIPVQVTGVGMFDFLHGQTGVAPNGIELHPVLNIVFNPSTTADFSFSVSPASLSVTQGSSGSTSLSTAALGGFNSSISLSASGLPAGVTATFNPAAVAAPGNGSSTLTFAASGTAATGTSNVTITASGGGVTHTATVALTINASTAPGFTMSASPAKLSVPQGTSGTATISTTVSGGFNSAVSLSASGLPAGVTAGFSPASIAAPGGGSSTLTFTASSTAAIGTSNVTVTAAGGGVTHTATIALTIPKTNILGITPPDHVVIVMEENHSFSEIIGSSAAPFINSLAQQGALFTQSFAVEHPSQPNYLDLFSGSNQGVTDDSCPHTFSTENLATELTAAGETFTGFSEDLPATGSTVCTSGAYAEKHAPWVNFTNVPAASNQPFTAFPTDFTTLPTIAMIDPNLNDDMHDGTIAQGDTWLQQNLSSYIQFAQTHNSLLIVTWDEDDNSQSNQIATIFVGPMVKQGQFAETINHFNVLRTLEDLYGLTHVGSAATATPISDVWKQAAADFSVTASPASLSVTQGSSGTASVSTTVSGGFNAAVSLSVSGLPTGVTASFNPTSIAAPGSGSSTVTFTASSTATTGTSNLSLTATGGGVSHTTVISLTINAPATPDFTLAASPASLSVAQGSSGTTTLSTTVSGGFNSAVSFSASGLPAGVTASFAPASIAAPGSGSSILTFTASSTATTGAATVMITATGGTVTHAVAIALTITAGGTGNTTTQILGNPGFENGSANSSPWTVTTTQSTNRIINSSSAEPPHSGTWDAWLDGHGATTTDTLMQQVSIAANATSATLSFWLHIDTAETSTTTAFDTLTVQVRNTSGTVLSTLATFSNLNHAAGYQQKTFDLTSFAGQTIQIFLQGKEDFELQTSFVVDDFTLNVTTPGSDTSPPTTSVTAPANGATVSGTTSITATASDNVGVTQMQLLIDGSIAASNTSATSLSFSWDTTKVGNGSHTIVSKAFDAAGNVGTSGTVTVTVSNTTTELISNGGFENGTNAAPWTTTSGVINNSAKEPPHTGGWDAWLDGYGTTHTDNIMQQVTIPSTATKATLSFWLHIDTAETSTTTAFDKFTVQVRNSSGTVLSTLANFSNLNAAAGYQQHTFDLTSFKGQTIQIFMQGVEDFELQTSFVVDDVSLQVTQ